MRIRIVTERYIDDAFFDTYAAIMSKIGPLDYAAWQALRDRGYYIIETTQDVERVRTKYTIEPQIPIDSEFSKDLSPNEKPHKKSEP